MKSVEGVELVTEPAGCRSNHWLRSRCSSQQQIEEAGRRAWLLESAHAADLLLRPVWKLLHQLPMYVEASRGALPVAEDQALRLVNLPSSPQLLQ